MFLWSFGPLVVDGRPSCAKLFAARRRVSALSSRAARKTLSEGLLYREI